MKVRIPQQHYEFYRLVYQYLHHTLSAETERYPDWELSKTLIANYLDKHRKGTPLTHLLENETPPQEDRGTHNPSSVLPLKKELPLHSEVIQLHEKISTCQNCFLGKFRKQYVKLPPVPRYPFMVVVDIPSFYDQTQGVYFTDQAGHLLIKILKSLSLEVEDIYYTAAVKCSYSQEITNRLGDALKCREHLLEEIRLLRPELILGFGKTTYDLLMLEDVEIHNQEFIDSKAFSQQMGKSLSFQGIDILFTHHPRDLLIHSNWKRDTWEHLKKLLPRIEEIKKINYVQSTRK